MRSRIPFFIALFVVVSFALPHVVHAAIPFYGPIIPQDATRNVCPANWGMLVQVINNIIEFLITIVITFVAPIMIAYSGFLFVANPVNAGGKEKAKSILTNTIVGIVVALSAWLIVDAIMAVLYNPPDGWGTWSSLITKDSGSCLGQQGALPRDNLNQSNLPPAGISAGGVGVGASSFTYTSEASAQVRDASGAVSSLLICINGHVPANTVVTSISDHFITNGSRTFRQCATQGGCSHAIKSCHYGGTGSCNGSSYAVDIKTPNQDALVAAAESCGASTLKESTHVHISVGYANGCNCDASLE